MHMRAFIVRMIAKRRAEIASKDFVSKGDFMTNILTDDLFTEHEVYAIDECITFMLAGTATTTLMISNSLYYLAADKEKGEKLRVDVSNFCKQTKPFKDFTEAEWKHFLLEEEAIMNCKYLSYCAAETLRRDPPLSHSTRLQITESVTIKGVTILKGQNLVVNMGYIHNRKDQWVEPDTYVPERFEPTSKYYLTPEGKKRHPLSYQPFLGGRRVCIGKTLAENIGKCILAMI